MSVFADWPVRALQAGYEVCRYLDTSPRFNKAQREVIHNVAADLQDEIANRETCTCGDPTSEGAHRDDGPCYVGPVPPPEATLETARARLASLLGANGPAMADEIREVLDRVSRDLDTVADSLLPNPPLASTRTHETHRGGKHG